MPFYGEIYEVDIVVTRDGVHPDDAATKQVKSSGIMPHIIPSTLETNLATNSDYHFNGNETRWSFRFSPIQPVKFCYRVCANFESYLAVEETTFCYTASDDFVGFMKGATTTKLGTIFNYDELLTKLDIGTAKLSKIVPQRQEEFAIAQYNEDLPSPLTFANVVLYSADCFKTVYALCATPTLYMSIREVMTDVFFWDGDDKFRTHVTAAWPDTLQKKFPEVCNYFTDKHNAYLMTGKAYVSSSKENNFANGKIPYETYDRELKAGWTPYVRLDNATGKSYIAWITIDFFTPYPESLEEFELEDGMVVLMIEFVYMPTHDYNCIAVAKDKNGGYSLIHVYMDCSSEKLVTGGEIQHLPKEIPNEARTFEAPLSLASYFWNGASPYPPGPIDIVGVRTFNGMFSRYVIYYGNILAISSQYGYTPSLLMTLGSEKITRLVTSKKSGYFAFITDKKRMFFGSAVSPSVVEIDYQKYTNEELDPDFYIIIFDDDDNLNLVNLKYITNRKIFILNPLDLLPSESLCPYKEISIKTWDTARLSRVILPEVDNAIPEHVYLDASDTFHIQISLTLASQVEPSLRIRQTKHLNVTKQVTRDWSLAMVIYDICVADGTPYSEEVLTNGYCFSDLLIIDFEEAGPMCEGSTVSINFTVGCLPYVSLVLEPRDPVVLDDGTVADVANFEKDWLPNIRLLDSVFGVSKQYTGNFDLKVIGGGPKADGIVYYSDEQIEEYNFGLSGRVWRYVDGGDEREARYENSTIAWVCSLNSPCGKVRPEPFNPVEYYFLFELRTVPKDVRGTSLCVLSTTFIVKVTGITMDVVTMLIFMLVSLCVVVLLTALIFVCYEQCDAKEGSEVDERVRACGAPEVVSEKKHV